MPFIRNVKENSTIPDSCCQRQRSNHSHDLAQYEFSLFLIRSSTSAEFITSIILDAHIYNVKTLRERLTFFPCLNQELFMID